MKTWKIQGKTEAGIKHYEISAATLQAALGKAMRDVLTLGKAATLSMEWELYGGSGSRGRRKMSNAERIERRIARDQKRLAEMGGEGGGEA